MGGRVGGLTGSETLQRYYSIIHTNEILKFHYANIGEYNGLAKGMCSNFIRSEYFNNKKKAIKTRYAAYNIL